MWVSRVELTNFRCFAKTEIAFQYPGRVDDRGVATALNGYDNINLILGDNGSGKSSLLKAIAVGVLGPWLEEWHVSLHHLVRVRGPLGRGTGDVVVDLIFPSSSKGEGDKLTLRANIAQAGLKQNRITGETSSYKPLGSSENRGTEVFLCGYGASRRIDTEAPPYPQMPPVFAENERYLRVQGLFEEGVKLAAFSPYFTWLSSMPPRGSVHHHYDEVFQLLHGALRGSAIERWMGSIHGQADFKLNDLEESRVLFRDLSDGNRAYVSWLGDLLRRLAEATPRGKKLRDVPGVILIDEIDLHLHPSWQTRLLPQLSEVFPSLQFIVTSHSPILAGSVPHDNVILAEKTDQGDSVLDWSDQEYYGRSVDEILTGPYFELSSTLPPELQLREEQLREQRVEWAQALTTERDPDKAKELIKRLASSWSE